jgi:hypothetical protein
VTASPAPTPPARRLHGRKEERRAALALFNQTAAVLWRDRAEIELRASGETLRRAESTPLYRLTPQELQIARFVATGATTKAVAAQLFLSPVPSTPTCGTSSGSWALRREPSSLAFRSASLLKAYSMSNRRFRRREPHRCKRLWTGTHCEDRYTSCIVRGCGIFDSLALPPDR